MNINSQKMGWHYVLLAWRSTHFLVKAATKYDFVLQTCNFTLYEIPKSDYQVAVLVKVTKPNLKKLRNRFMNYMGGQDNLVCEVHKLPLMLDYVKYKNITPVGRRSTFVVQTSIETSSYKNHMLPLYVMTE